MGAGKSTLGKLLSQKLHLHFIDLDDWIVQKEKKNIAQIFQEEGEPRFRQMETEALQTLTQEQNILLATGGGAPILPQNQKLLKNGRVFYLHSTPSKLYERLKADSTRPLLKENPLEALTQLYQARHPVYLSLADCIFDLNDLSLEESQELIFSAYEHLYPAIAL